MIRIFSIIMFLWAWHCANAQNIVVEDFRKLHKLPLIQGNKFATDKHNAIVDFITSTKGLQFWADGKTQAPTADIDGGISVMVPSGTSYIKISHPQYGTLLWKEPNVRFKRKCHYSATLTAFDPDSDFKPQSQWLIFNVTPPDILLQVDSTTYVLRQGYKELELPLGVHSYSISAPFHATICDSILLADQYPERLAVSLQPQFSYLTVVPPLQQTEVFVDNISIGSGTSTSQRLQAGTHRVRLMFDDIMLYDEDVTVGAAEKQTLTIAFDQLSAHYVTDASPTAGVSYKAVSEDGNITDYAVEQAMPKGFLSISCDVSDAEVYVDGKVSGHSPLIVGGLSSKRSHEVRIKKDGYVDAFKIVTPVTNELTKVRLTLKENKKKNK